MSRKTLLIARLLHIIAAVYNLLFVYTVLHDWSYGLLIVQYVTLPLLMVSGYIMMRAKRKMRISAIA